MKKIAIAMSLLFLTGCTRYAPRAPRPLAYYNSQINTEFSSGTWFTAYNTAPSVSERNRLIGEFVWSIDRNYDRFEVAFYNGKAKEDIAGDFLGLGLGGASTLLTNAATKSILALIATTVVGGKASIDDHWYNMQTREAIVSQMRALRANQLMQIDQGMKDSLDSYSLTQGIIDAQAYYQAGSVVEALQAISQNAGAQATSAKKMLNQMRNPVR